MFFSRSVYRFASPEVRRELAPLVHSAWSEAGPAPLVYRLHGQHTVPLPCWPCCPRYYRRTHVDTFCLLMIEIEIIPARHRAKGRRGIAAATRPAEHRAASCKVGLTPLSISLCLRRRRIVLDTLSKERIRILLRLSYAFRSIFETIDSKFDAAFIHTPSFEFFLNFIPRKIGKRLPANHTSGHNDNPCDFPRDKRGIRCLAWQRETRIEPLTEISTAMRAVFSGSYQWRVGGSGEARHVVSSKQNKPAMREGSRAHAPEKETSASRRRDVKWRSGVTQQAGEREGKRSGLLTALVYETSGIEPRNLRMKKRRGEEGKESS